MSSIVAPLEVRLSLLRSRWRRGDSHSFPVLQSPRLHRPAGSARSARLARSLRGWLAIGITFALAAVNGGGAPTMAAAANRAGDSDPSAAAVECDGWQDASASDAYLMDVLALGPDHAWTAGAELNRRGPRRPLVETWNGKEWTRSLGAVAGPDNVFTSISGTGSHDLWAVGFHSIGEFDFHDLAEHWNGSYWTVDSPPTSSGAQMLVGVEAVSSSNVWAVGYRVARQGRKKPVVWQHTAAGWSAHHPFVPAATSAALTGVAAAGADDIWAVGWTSHGGVTLPLLEHWNGHLWTRTSVAGVNSSEAVLADITAGGPAQIWSVGYRRVGTATRPLVMRWTGGAWSVVPGPVTPDPMTLLTGVAIAGPDAIWVVGAGYDMSSRSFHALAAHHDVNGWSIQPGASGQPYTLIRAVSGPLGGTGWAVAWSKAGSAHVRACPPTQAQAASIAPRADPGTSADPDDEVGWEPNPSGRDALSHVPPIEAARSLIGIRAHDVASAAGVDDFAWSHGGVNGDFDRNGWPDLFISRHGGPARLLMNHSGQFSELIAGAFPPVDRHGCDAGDLDGSGKPDIYCALGASRGTGVKANELWLDPGSGQAVDGSVPAGVADPIGRGRTPAVFDADGDGKPDLFLGNSPHRFDGLPSPSRFFRNTGRGTFVAAPEAGLDNTLGAWCVIPVDFDGDGDFDLLLCAHDENSTSPPRIRLFRNTGGRFRDATAALGIRSVGERDADLVDLDRDGHLDLVQLGYGRLRVSLQRDGTLVTVYERSIGAGHTVASGDVNGDRYPDLYIQRGIGDVNHPDLLLVNDGTGRSFSSAAIPETTQGSAEDVIAIDYDRNGLTDFVVLNGWKRPGPVQLIAFTKTN